MISFIVILAIPLILGGALYWESLRVVERSEIETRVTMLEQRKRVLDNYFDDVERILVRITLDPELEKALSVGPVTYGSTSIVNILDTQKRLEAYTHPGTIDSRAVIYLRSSDVILDGEWVYFGAPRYFTNTLAFEGYGYDQWDDQILASRHDRSILPATEVHGRLSTDIDIVSTREYVTMVSSLPYGGDAVETLGTLLLLVDARQANEVLQGGTHSHGGSTYLLDGNGNVVVGPRDRPLPIVDRWSVPDEGTSMAFSEVDDARAMAISLRSGFRDWTYLTLMPRSIVTAQTSRLRILMLVVLGISILLGLAAAFVLTGRRLRPLAEIGNLLKGGAQAEPDQPVVGFDFVRSGVQRIITANEKLSNEVTAEREALSEAVIRRVLSYELRDEREIQNSLEHISFNITGRRFISIVCWIDGGHDETTREQATTAVKALRSAIGQTGGVFEWETGRYVALIGLDNSDEMFCTTLVNSQIRKFRARVGPELRRRLYIGIGGFCSTLTDLRLSFAQASDALEVLVSGHAGLTDLWYRDIESSSTGFHYPVDAEQRLVTMATCGNRREITRTLSQIYTDNFTDRKLMPYMRRQLHHELHGTLVKVRDHLEMDSTEGDADLIRSIDRDGELFFANLQAAYLRICDAVDEAKRSHNSALAQEVVAFTRNNFRSTTFGACTVAREYGLSDSYFSRFFKEQVGERFIDYLQELRIRTACELIDNGGLTLQAVAREVGYATSQSFRRGFKKVVGVLPTEYQKRRATR